MSVEVELGHWQCRRCDVVFGAHGDTTRDVTLTYDVSDRVLHATTQMGESLGDWTVGTITRISAKEFTFATTDGGFVSSYSRGCGCSGG